jgi:hypothetical protein
MPTDVRRLMSIRRIAQVLHSLGVIDYLGWVSLPLELIGSGSWLHLRQNLSVMRPVRD